MQKPTVSWGQGQMRLCKEMNCSLFIAAFPFSHGLLEITRTVKAFHYAEMKNTI